MCPASLNNVGEFGADVAAMRAKSKVPLMAEQSQAPGIGVVATSRIDVDSILPGHV
jgi:hypothetical protein